ncbi:unnamed protein product, partial [Strongylus vulgaris]
EGCGFHLAVAWNKKKDALGLKKYLKGARRDRQVLRWWNTVKGAQQPEEPPPQTSSQSRRRRCGYDLNAPRFVASVEPNFSGISYNASIRRWQSFYAASGVATPMPRHNS